MARLRGRDIQSELDHLRSLPQSRSYTLVTCFLIVLLGLAFLGASFGPWGLLTYLLIILFVFR
jgi:hypothetical protein